MSNGRRRLLLSALPLALASGFLLSACSPGCTEGECPSVEALREYRPPEATRVYAVDGSLLADLSPHRRIVVELEQMPEVVRDGFVAVEDRRFWDHDGVDVRGVGRAVVRNVVLAVVQRGLQHDHHAARAQRVPRPRCRAPSSSSASTGRSSSPARSRTNSRRSEILAMYLNQIYLGDGLYGVEAASRGYFGKPSAELDRARSRDARRARQEPDRLQPAQESGARGRAPQHRARRDGARRSDRSGIGSSVSARRRSGSRRRRKPRARRRTSSRRSGASCASASDRPPT